MKRGAVLAAMLAAANCMAGGTYPPSPTDATLRYAGGMAQHTFCTATARYTEEPDSLSALFSRVDRTSRLPSGGRVTLSSAWDIQFNQHRHFHCTVRISFVPQAGASYLTDVRINAAGNCEAELVREDPSARAGVVPEPSLGPPSC